MSEMEVLEKDGWISLTPSVHGEQVSQPCSGPRGFSGMGVARRCRQPGDPPTWRVVPGPQPPSSGTPGCGNFNSFGAREGGGLGAGGLIPAQALSHQSLSVEINSRQSPCSVRGAGQQAEHTGAGAILSGPPRLLHESQGHRFLIWGRADFREHTGVALSPWGLRRTALAWGGRCVVSYSPHLHLSRPQAAP